MTFKHEVEEATKKEVIQKMEDTQLRVKNHLKDDF